MTIYKPKILLAIASPAGRERFPTNPIITSFLRKQCPFTILEHTTSKLLYQTLEAKQHNILHFIGHGSQNSLTLETSLGFEHQVSLDWLQDVLDCSDVQLAILYACNTFPNSLKIPMIGLNAEGTPDGAIIFAENFYEGLVKGLTISNSYKHAKKYLKIVIDYYRKQGYQIQGQPLSEKLDSPNYQITQERIDEWINFY